MAGWLSPPVTTGRAPQLQVLGSDAVPLVLQFSSFATIYCELLLHRQQITQACLQKQ